MSPLILILWLIFFGPGNDTNFPGRATENRYTASTPAGPEVRNFLGIKAADSIDFIRWQLFISNEQKFELQCAYGISKPNTNGFISEKRVNFSGSVQQTNNQLNLMYDSRKLSLLMLNTNILHILNSDNTMMVGNDGWSYTLNALKKSAGDVTKLPTFDPQFGDSMIITGRTPCQGIEELTEGRTRPDCYKKKWKILLRRDNPGSTTGTYRIGPADARTGKWIMKNDGDGRLIYSLDLNNGNSLNLLQTDKNIMYLLDPKGQLMVGDHDFSYSLNRRIE